MLNYIIKNFDMQGGFCFQQLSDEIFKIGTNRQGTAFSNDNIFFLTSFSGLILSYNCIKMWEKIEVSMSGNPYHTNFFIEA